MLNYDTPSMAPGHQSLVIEKYNNPDWSPELGQYSGFGSTKRGQAVNLNSLGKGYFNVDQNNQSHFCKRVDEEVC